MFGYWFDNVHRILIKLLFFRIILFIFLTVISNGLFFHACFTWVLWWFFGWLEYFLVFWFCLFLIPTEKLLLDLGHTLLMFILRVAYKTFKCSFLRPFHCFQFWLITAMNLIVGHFVIILLLVSFFLHAGGLSVGFWRPTLFREGYPALPDNFFYALFFYTLFFCAFFFFAFFLFFCLVVVVVLKISGSVGGNRWKVHLHCVRCKPAHSYSFAVFHRSFALAFLDKTLNLVTPFLDQINLVETVVVEIRTSSKLGLPRTLISL